MSKYAHGKDSTIILKASDYRAEELAALVTFLKLQSTWSGSGMLAWREEAQEDTQEKVAQDSMEEAFGAGGKGSSQNGEESAATVGMKGEAIRDEM